MWKWNVGDAGVSMDAKRLLRRWLGHYNHDVTRNWAATGTNVVSTMLETEAFLAQDEPVVSERPDTDNKPDAIVPADSKGAQDQDSGDIDTKSVPKPNSADTNDEPKERFYLHKTKGTYRRLLMDRENPDLKGERCIPVINELARENAAKARAKRIWREVAEIASERIKELEAAGRCVLECDEDNDSANWPGALSALRAALGRGTNRKAAPE